VEQELTREAFLVVFQQMLDETKAYLDERYNERLEAIEKRQDELCDLLELILTKGI
jgi:hypothetical protein